MKRIGVLYGIEESFPFALVDRINAMGVKGVGAEPVSVGAVEMAASCGYDVIVDRASPGIRFYQSFLKNAALTGTRVINDPFRWCADDKFFHYSLASELDVAAPPTVLLPHKRHPEGTTEESMRNLAFPLNWESTFDYVGFPAVLKPLSGGNRRLVHKVNSPEEFFQAYDESGEVCMTLQRAVKYAECFHAYVIGQSKVRLMRCEPGAGPGSRHVQGNPPPAGPLGSRMESDALKLCRAVGYDINMVEFAVEDGTPYAIDFLNPVPDAAAESVGPENFRWLTEAVAELAVERAQAPAGAAPYPWRAALAEA
jgi:glutathione synthase/RimK-type ligase-like ATP-grasp enzyme